MHLSTKITRYATGIVVIVLSFGFLIFYMAMRRTTEQSAAGKLKDLNQAISTKLRSGVQLETLQQAFPQVSIDLLDKTDLAVSRDHQTHAAYSWNPEYQTKLYRIQVASYPIVGSQQYCIRSEFLLPIIDGDFFVGLMMVVAWIFAFTVISNLFLGELIAKSLYSPFYSLLDTMRTFDVRKRQHIRVEQTKVEEFRDINGMLQRLTSQTIEHYSALEEFTENLSHEIQTPLANIKGKIELLINTDLQTDQLEQLSSMNDSVLKISSINHSLVLLMSLEQQRPEAAALNLHDMIGETLLDHEEILLMKEMRTNMWIDEQQLMYINPILVKMVWTNLMSNAIRYNYHGGTIEIYWNAGQLFFRNTGEDTALHEELIFSRFHSGNKHVGSIGIGLALVRKILCAYGYVISYQFEDALWHTFIIKSERQ